MNKTLYLASILGAASLTAGAHTVQFDQNFNGDYSVDFPTVLELDHQQPAYNVSPLFQNSEGVSMPWWHLKDSNSSDDRFLCSHSNYHKPGKSNDWLGSRAIEIPTEGFKLTFGAQSYVMREGDRLSDLWLFITEEPLSQDNLPTEPTQVYTRIGVGSDNETIEGDFIPFEVDLTPWAGKTIYINFANLNEDRDILAIDNVLVRRLDNAEVSIDALDGYVLAGDFPVTARIAATSETAIGAWTLTFNDGNDNVTVEKGESLTPGESLEFTFTGTVEADKTADYSVTLAVEGEEPIVASGTVKGMSFMPTHRVLLEESTGTWCGNCPLGFYTIESMMLDPDMKDRVIPVSVHIPGGGNDYMVNERYAAQFGVTSAPMYRAERDLRVTGFSMLDATYDPSNTSTAAGKIRQLSEKPALADIQLEASYNYAGNKATSVICDIKVTPAVSIDAPLGIGIIMTENNVTFNTANPAWKQTNYFSGNTELESELGGWTRLPDHASNVRFQDVARGIWGYRGLDGSLPETLSMDKAETFTYEVEVPETFLEIENQSTGKKTVVSQSIVPENVVMVAYLINRESGEVLNAVSFPMSEQAEERFTVADLVKELSGIEDVTAGTDAPAQYFNLQGMRIANPAKGQIVIERRGSETRKIVF